MITLEKLKALNPCENRLDNYVKHYDKRTLTKAQFMRLKHITQADKVWVAYRLMPKENARFAVADIAESVLHIYESKYPNDDRPRKTIESARAASLTGVCAATHASFYSAYSAYAASLAVDVDVRAALDVRAAADAAYAASYATADARAAVRAADLAARAAPNREAQEKLIRRIILKYWKEQP